MRARALSTAVGASIMVAVTVALALAVGLWTQQTATRYMELDELRIESARSWHGVLPQPPLGDGWTLNLKLRNTGSRQLGIVGILLNGGELYEFGQDPAELPPLNDYVRAYWTTSWIWIDPTDVELNIDAGDRQTLYLLIDDRAALGSFKSGRTVEVQLITASGQVFTALVRLS